MTRCGTIRSSLSTTAATGGVLLGAFVAVQLLATPKLPSDSAMALAAVETKAAPKPVDEIKPAPKPVAETTGSAPAGESVASADCEQQTWPHLSRVCMEEYRAKNRSARVVTTDKLDKPTITAIETQPPAASDGARFTGCGESGRRACLAAAARRCETGRIRVGGCNPAASGVASADASAGRCTRCRLGNARAERASRGPSRRYDAAGPARAISCSDPNAVGQERSEGTAPRQKAKRKLKGEPKAPAKQDVDDDGNTFASADPDERAFEDRNSDRFEDAPP